MAQAHCDQPVTYEIRVVGRISTYWSARVNGMTITPGENETRLIGQLADQAALLGVLTALYDWGYSLISVRQVSDSTHWPA